ncbi:MAG: protein kinase [Planctomycetota bacterium]
MGEVERYSGCVLLERLGAGAMGEVHRARRDADGAEVVVKLLSGGVGVEPHLLARFAREADALRRLPAHPNLVAVLAVGGEPRPHIVMELVRGPSLRDLVRARKRLQPRVAARYARDAALGLAAAHAQGILHRDVKPGNLLLDGETDTVRVVDFGLAKDLFLSGVTGPGQLLGTAAYMAPEQWDEGREQDERVDVFGLAVTLYHLIAGRPPFVAESALAIAEKTLAGEYVPLDERVPGVSVELARVVDQALHRDLEYRTARMDLLARDLEAVLEDRPPPGLPALVERDGRRHYLVPWRRFVIGSGEEAEVRLEARGVAPAHAQLRREPRGFLVADLLSRRGTFVEDARVTSPVPLRHLARLRVADTELRLHFPGAPSAPAFLDDVERAPLADPLLRALLRAGDPRTLALALERAEPWPWKLERGRALVAQLLGEEPAARAAIRVAAAERADVAAALARLAREAPPEGEPAGPPRADRSTEEWRVEWMRTRAARGPQVGPPPGPALRVEAWREGRLLADLGLADLGLVLVGRDEKCHLQLRLRKISRLHATLARLHERWLLRVEGRHGAWRGDAPVSGVEWFDPAAPLVLGDVELRMVCEDPLTLPELGMGGHAVDPAWFFALAEDCHPGTASGLVGLLQEPRHRAWLEGAARALFPGGPAAADALYRDARAELHARLDLARRALPFLLGSDPGQDLAAWSQLLARRRGELGPQLLPAGWLAATRRGAATVRLRPGRELGLGEAEA